MASPVERRVCPPHYQEKLTRAGGVNRYGTPNFRIDWGQTYTVRRGGIWDSGDYYFRGYRDEFEDGRSCWVLRQFNPPELYLSPEIWFRENRCPKTGLQLLGDYHWRGQYEAIQPLVWRGLINDRMVVEHMPLNGLIVDILIRMVIKYRELQDWRKRIAIEEIRHRKERELDSKIESARHNAKVAFTGPVSYARQGSRTSLVDRQIKVLEDHWYAAVTRLRREGLGVTIH